MKILKALTGLLLTVLLTGCSVSENSMSDYKGTSKYFKTLSDEEFGKIEYDTRTGVEYWRSEETGDLTLLINADGKPLIYEMGDKECSKSEEEYER